MARLAAGQKGLTAHKIDGYGALAQLGERYNGIVEVSGSIPLGSTIKGKSRISYEIRTLADEFSSAGVFRVYWRLVAPNRSLDTYV